MPQTSETTTEQRDINFYRNNIETVKGIYIAEEAHEVDTKDACGASDFNKGAEFTREGADGSSDEIGDLERKIIDFERQWWKYPGAKDTAIRERFDMTATRYYAVLNALIDQPAAAAYDPLVVHRLQRLRDARKAQRTARLRDFA